MNDHTPDPAPDPALDQDPALHSDPALERLLGPRGEELTCEMCFELLDEYVDHELAGDDADARVPGMRAHLDGCPACREDHESLRALVAAEGG